MDRIHQRHIPIRMCVICRRRFPKSSLIRFVKQLNSHGRPATVLDEKQHRPGRGFYICNSPNCQKKIEKVSGWHGKCGGES